MTAPQEVSGLASSGASVTGWALEKSGRSGGVGVVLLEVVGWLEILGVFMRVLYIIRRRIGRRGRRGCEG